MSQSAPFSLRNLHLRQQRSADGDAILNALPFATLYIDLVRKRIVTGNRAAAILCQREQAKLGGLFISEIIPDWEEAWLAIEPLEDGRVSDEQVSELCVVNQATIPVSFTIHPVRNDKNHALMLLNPRPAPKRRVNRIPPGMSYEQSDSWKMLKHLAEAHQQTELIDAVNSALKAIKLMTQADILAVYGVDEEQPRLKKVTSIGVDYQLPGELPLKDIPQKHTPYIWMPGQRTISHLHRILEKAGFKYVVTVPLDQNSATLGLLCLAGTADIPDEKSLLDTLQVFTTQLVLLIQNHRQRVEFNNQLSRQSFIRLYGEQIADQLQEGLLILTPDQRIQWLNRPAATLFGYSQREACGQLVDHLLVGREEFTAGFKEIVAGKVERTLEKQHLYQRNGEAFLANVTIIPMLEENATYAFGIIVQDLTSIEQIQVQTHILEQKAELGEFIAVFAHEVRNPINNITSGLELLNYNLAQDDPNQATIQRMLQDCDRLGELMKSVLALSRPTEYRMEPLDVAQLINRLLDRIAYRLQRQKISQQVQIEPDLPAISGNHRALEQVFNNIISNALQAMSETGGQLSVKIQRQSIAENQECVQVSIADNGPGISPEAQEKLFQPFYTTNRDGTGLGLPIARRIISLHQGSIRVNSFPGGTIFYILLPIAEQPVESRFDTL